MLLKNKTLLSVINVITTKDYLLKKIKKIKSNLSYKPSAEMLGPLLQRPIKFLNWFRASPIICSNRSLFIILLQNF